MTTLVLYRLADPVASRVRAAVHDLTALGLAGPSFWLDLGDSGRSVVRLAAEGITAEPLTTWLHSATAPQLVVLQTDGGFVAEQDFAALAAEAPALATRAAELLNVLVPTGTGAELFPTSSTFGSRRNVVLAPVESVEPAPPSDTDASLPTFAAGTAVAFAAVAGLWVGSTPPLSTAVSGSDVAGRQALVVRSYVRVIDASALVDRMREHAFADGADRLPLASEALHEVDDASAVGAAVATAASFVQANADALRFHLPAAAKPRDPVPLTPLQAIGRFLVDFVTSLFSLAELRSAIDSLQAAAAGALTRALYGPERSHYVVVVNGIPPVSAGDDAAEELASWLADAARRLDPDAAPFIPDATAELWEDFVRTAAALVDGGPTPAEVELPRVGDARALVRSPSAIAPPPESAAFVAELTVDGVLRTLTAESDDPYAARIVARQIDVAARSGGSADGWNAASGVGASDASARLSQWRRERSGFVWEVGDRLAGELDSARTWLAQRLTPKALDTQLAARVALAAATFRRRRWGALIGFLALVVAVTCGWIFLGPVLGGGMLWLLTGLGVLVWFAAASIPLVRAKQRHHQLSNQVNVDEDRYRDDITAFVAGTRETQRLANLYGQYRLWARVLAAVVHQPFGAAAPGGDAGRLSASALGGARPAALRVATASQKSAPLNEVDRVRQQLYRRGWLARLAADRFETAFSVAETVSHWSRSGRPSADPSLSPQGALATLARTITLPETGARFRNRVVAQFDELIAEAAATRFAALVGRVDTGSGGPMATADFLRGVTGSVAYGIGSAQSPFGVGAGAASPTRVVLGRRGAGATPQPGLQDGAVPVHDMEFEAASDGDVLDVFVSRLDILGPHPHTHFSYFADSVPRRVGP